ncbi:MAG: tetratricopeptide repeat protein, partial [Chitinophagaceae bacterium]
FTTISWAYNKTESIFTISFYVVTMISYFNMASLLYCRPNLLKVVSYFIIAMLITEDLYLFYILSQKIGNIQIDYISNSLVWTAGNKNIFAASIMLKLPFLFYLIHSGSNLQRLLISPLLAIFSFTIVLLASRESQLNLLIQTLIFTGYIIWTTYYTNKWKWGLQLSGFFLIPVISGLLFANVIVKEAKAQGLSLGMTTSLTERISTIGLTEKESSFRVQQWSAALDFFSKHPLTGTGIGNWKIFSLPYETYSKDFYSSKFVHNDFIQMFAGTGIVGGLLYLTFFILLSFFALRLYIRSENQETGILTLVIGVVLFSYMIDAFFSFPQERPVMQMYLALSAGWITSLYVCKNEKANFRVGPPSKILMGIFLLMLLPCFWLTANIYKSAKQQSVYVYDFTKSEPEKNWSPETDEFPAVPNLAITSVPIDLIKSRYLIKAGRYAEAASYIEKSKEANPNNPLIPFFSSLLHFYQGNLDSAFVHAIASLKYRPRVKNNINLIHMILSKEPDVTKLHKGYEEALKIKNDDYLYAGYINILKLKKADSLLTRKIIADATTFHPTSFSVHYEAANYEYDLGNFDNSFSYCEKLTRITPGNGGAWQNMGLIRFRQNRFQEALGYFDKAISLNAPGGVSQLLKGQCFLGMGNSTEACEWINKAVALGNQEAKGFQERFCSP